MLSRLEKMVKPTKENTKVSFKPFEMIVVCKGCGKELGLVISEVHLQTDIMCPVCFRPLSGIIRREIRKRV